VGGTVGRTIWATFNWTEQVDPDTALRRQETLMELVEERQLVVKTAVLERVIDQWSSRRCGARRSRTRALSGSRSPGWCLAA
jgi:hypothetical protein